jgi:hypothetical protein
VNAYDPNPLSGEPIGADDDIDSYNTPVPQITLITKRGSPALMSKRIFLDGDGKLKSDGSECRMVTGAATRDLRSWEATSRGLSATAVLIRRLLWEPCERTSPAPSASRQRTTSTRTPAPSPGRGASSTIGAEFLLGA